MNRHECVVSRGQGQMVGQEVQGRQEKLIGEVNARSL